MGQRNNDLGRLQPRGVIGIEVGKHDKAGAIEDVGGGYRQHPTFRSGLRRIGVAQRQVRGPESLWDGKGDAIARCDFAPRILQYRKRRFAVTTGRGRRTSSLRRESDKRCAQAFDFRVGRRERLQFENTKGAPRTPEKGDDDGTTIKKIRKIETAAPALEPEETRRLAGLYGLGDEACLSERPDRAPRGINHLWFGVRLVFATACVKLRLQRHGAAPVKRGGTCGAFLIPADLRHPSRGNIVYSKGE
jgi:hypothetical protein